MNRQSADAHIHLFRTGFRNPGLGDGDLTTYEVLRRRADIGTALVVGYEGEPRFHGNNDDILALSQEHDWIAPVAYVPTGRPPARGWFATARQRGFRGFSLYLTEAGPGIESWSPHVLSELADGNPVISVNATPAALARHGATLERLEGAQLLISHLGNPGPRATEQAGLDVLLKPLITLARHPYIGVKLSGLYAIDPSYPHGGARAAALRTLDAFGASRMAWGSDFSPALGSVSAENLLTIPDWFSNALSNAELTAVQGGTLVAMLRLAQSAGGGST